MSMTKKKNAEKRAVAAIRTIVDAAKELAKAEEIYFKEESDMVKRTPKQQRASKE